MAWYKLTLNPFDSSITSEELDSICSELMDAGATGTTIDAPPTIGCFVDGASAEVLLPFVELAQRLGCQVTSQEEILEQNWAMSCPELWQPIHAGKLQVIPVESVHDTTPVDAGSIKIIPGLGFGTGHHATTNMILSVLGDFVPAQPISRVFDLGTGSGILAIAAAKLFNAPVIATDIDPLAINNARENIELNGASHLVSASTDPISAIKGSFPLILANLYGEALVQMCGDITRLAGPGCTAILSGITELVCDSVTEAFCAAHGWQLTQELSQPGWVCLVLTRG